MLATSAISPWLYRPYQAQDGLPDISVTGITQTEDGYLWVATRGGLIAFNGAKFSPLPQANFPALPSRAVRAVFRDHRDNLWLAMERGPLFCFRPDGSASFTWKEELPGQRVLRITEDHEGAVWVVYPRQLRRILDGRAQPINLPSEWSDQTSLLGTSDRAGNIWCAKGTRLAVWRDDQWQSEVRFNTRITAISAGSRSNLWVATDGGIFTCEADKEPVKMFQVSSNTVPWLLLEDRSGAIWLGTTPDGLFRWRAGQLERVPTSNRDIMCLFEDQEDNIWAGTEGGGLNLIRPRTAGLLGRETGLPFESVQSVTEDSEGWLWAVGQDGRLARSKDNRWEVMSSSTNWPGGNATCVAADPVLGVWVGTSSQGLKHFRDGVWRGWQQRDGLVSDAVRSLLVASNGDVWVASVGPNRLQRLHQGKVTVITGSTQLGAIRALAEASDGSILLGTSEGQIQRVMGSVLVPETAVIEPWPLSVRSMLATSDGNVWIGYAGDGLGCLKDGKYRRLSTADGLTDDFISQLLEDDNGNLWIIGNRGLSRVSLAELNAVMAGKSARVSARAYGSVDGLPGMQPNRNNSPSAWRSRDGQLWFAMHSGLLAVQPENIHDNPHPPPVHLEQVRVDDKLVALYNAGSPLQTRSASNCVNLRDWTKPLLIGPGHRKVEINFAALSFTSPENVQCRFRLKGFDAGWIEAESSRHATYPRLSAGDYEFHVIACNNAGVWNETGAMLRLAVSPFFYETWWFKVGGALAMVIVTGGTALALSRRRYRQKLRRLEARRALEHERARIARDIHDDLGASLIRISVLSQRSRTGYGDAATAAESLEQIHQTARELTHAMGEVVWAVNPEHDTFDSLASYISNYAQNFLRVAAIRCRIEMPLQLPRQPLFAEIRHNLFLAFKEALNNVVKHAAASEVRISLTPNESGFELLVADNGKGFSHVALNAQVAGEHPSRPASGNGLANMQSRLQEIGGECELKSEVGAGTRVIFRIMLKTHNGQL